MSVNATEAATPESITMLFRKGQARIGPGETKRLHAFLQKIDVDRAFVITGYTDATGNIAANKRLANLRAMAVKAVVMRSQHSPRVTINATAACCDGSNIDENSRTKSDTETTRAQSRRVHLEMQ
jgi:outer membrane protein OmpA-like peptidoglycan-associated protein